ncbi:MAG: class I SAM-dependent methyltransferase [Gemmatimonadota bacterium]
MTCSQCRGIELLFDDRMARRELKRYRRRGPSLSTRKLLDLLQEQGVRGRTFLDIGGGIGAVQHELMAAGATGGTHADASPAYLHVSSEEARARGHESRIHYVEGDFVEIADTIDEADLVTLDRVVCCYPDMEGLIDASAPKARVAYGLVYPRDTRITGWVFGLVNLVQRLRRHPFRVFLHPTAEVEARIARHGLHKRTVHRGLIWQVVVFDRPKTA